MVCLQIYRELLSPATFLQVHSNSKEAILPLLAKYVSYLENYLSYQAKIFLVNQTPREVTPCKISVSVAATLVKMICADKYDANLMQILDLQICLKFLSEWIYVK